MTDFNKTLSLYDWSGEDTRLEVEDNYYPEPGYEQILVSVGDSEDTFGVALDVKQVTQLSQYLQVWLHNAELVKDE